MEEACEGTNDKLLARMCGQHEGGISGCAGRVKCSSDCHCLLCSSDMTLWASEASPFFPKTKGGVLGEQATCGVGTSPHHRNQGVICSGEFVGLCKV